MAVEIDQRISRILLRKKDLTNEKGVICNFQDMRNAALKIY